jgi:protein-disulfide isomerase
VERILKKHRRKVRLVFKHQPLPFHKDAKLAAQAVVAAGAQGKYWEMHDLLFANNRALKPDDLESYARQLGLDMAGFRADLYDPSVAALVEADMALAQKVGARGTPTFFINGVKLVGAQPETKFDEAIAAAIQRAKPHTRKRLKGDKLYKAIMKKATAGRK